MSIQQAAAVAEQLGELQLTGDRLQSEIERLNKKTIVTLTAEEYK